jgi:hypothetical protein
MSELIVDRLEGSATTQILLEGNAGGRPVNINMTLASRFRPIDSWLDVEDALGSLEGEILVTEARFDTQRNDEPFHFVFARTDSSFSLSGGPRNMLRLKLNRQGDLYAALSAPSPVMGSVAGTITSRTIDVACPDLYVDLTGLWRFVPPNLELALTGGYATGQVAIRGPIGDPEFFGTARGNSVRLKVIKFIPEDIRPVPFDVLIEGNEMNFGPVPTAVGAGKGTAAGWFRFDRWVPNIFNIALSVPQESPIPFSFDIAGFLASGNTAGNLNLSMSDMVLDVSGELSAHDTEISLNAEEVIASQNIDIFAQSIIPVTVDIGVITGKKVEFVWPSSQFPIIQAYANMGTQARITSDTQARRFSITSDVRIRSGEIFYFERSFYIRDGILSFRENEIQFAPRITARAEVRDQTNDGPVTISLIVENAPLLNFTARFESNPPLSQMEIFSLLGQNLAGSPADEESGAIQQAFINSTTDLLAQFQIVRRAERQIRDLFQLDMFTVRTQLLQNALFQATGLRDPVDRNGGVGNYFDNTTVFLGKYLGTDVFGQAMFSFRYDANRMVFGGISSSGVTLGSGMSLEADFGVEIRGPLFDIRWNFVPLHPENLFINDNSISLIWNWSF